MSTIEQDNYANASQALKAGHTDALRAAMHWRNVAQTLTDYRSTPMLPHLPYGHEEC